MNIKEELISSSSSSSTTTTLKRKTVITENKKKEKLCLSQPILSPHIPKLAFKKAWKRKSHEALQTKDTITSRLLSQEELMAGKTSSASLHCTLLNFGDQVYTGEKGSNASQAKVKSTTGACTKLSNCNFRLRTVGVPKREETKDASVMDEKETTCTLEKTDQVSGSEAEDQEAKKQSDRATILRKRKRTSSVSQQMEPAIMSQLVRRRIEVEAKPAGQVRTRPKVKNALLYVF